MNLSPSIPYIHLGCAQDVIAKSKSSFFLSFWFVSRKKSLALKIIYAFARIIDDCVDEPMDLEQKKEALSFWKENLTLAWNSQDSHPIMQEVVKIARDYQISQDILFGIIRGCEMDLYQSRYKTYADTLDYCYHVASLIGIACTHIFGDTSAQALEMATKLGKAFQLTNILRDVKEDWDRGRIYIAQEDLRRYQIQMEDLSSPGWQHLLLDYAERAENFYNEAFGYLKLDPQNCLRPAQIMASAYYKILSKLRQKRFTNLHERVQLSFLEKIFTLV